MRISSHSAKDQDALFHSIRLTYGTEGSVVYYLNADSKVFSQNKSCALSLTFAESSSGDWHGQKEDSVVRISESLAREDEGASQSHWQE